MITYLEAAAAGRLAVRAGGAAERRPAVPLPPHQRHVGVPRRAEDAGDSQVPVDLLWVVQVVRRRHAARLLRRRAVGGQADHDQCHENQH